MKNKLILLLGSLLASITLALAQKITVNGIVFSDEDNEPIQGATVQIKGMNIGTITDADGKFLLSDVPSSAQTLIVSFLGMHPEEVAIKPNLKITLETDVQQMGEVLVVAFGEQKKAAFTGSAGVIKAENIGARQVTNVVDALTGKVAGVQMINASGAPDATPDIRIRGLSSINAGKDPLIILDGMPYDGGWNNINPSDVESLTVLKDAASNALYGARGANGVIMITTKRAKVGEAVVSLDAKWGVNTRGSKTYDYITDPGQYYEQHYLALYNYYQRNQGQSAYDAHKNANAMIPQSSANGGLGYLVYNVPDGQYLIGENGRLNPNATLGNIVNYKGQDYLLTPDNWLDEAYKSSLRQEYNLNINGGTDKIQFYASLGYLKNEGVVSNSDYERYSGRLKASYQAKKWMKVGGNISYTHNIINGIAGVSPKDLSSTNLFGHVTDIAPIYPLYVRDAQGNIMQDENGNLYDYGKGNNAGLERAVLPNTNPLQTDRLNTNKTNGNSVNGNGFMDISFLKDFKLSLNIGVSDYERRITNTTQPFYGYYAGQGGYVYTYHYRTTTVNFQQLLNYNKKIGDHSISALLGHENYKYNYAYVWGSKTNMYSYFGNQELAGAITLNDTSSESTDYNTEGYFLRGQYDYKETYFLSGSYRRDASSRFHPDHRWGNFWSVGGAWIVSKEAWFKQSWIDMLKFKASYGSQGNDDIGYDRYTDTYDVKDSDGSISLVFKTKGNENITWETNGNFNTGIEFELFKGRLNGSIDYFYRKTTDMLCWLGTPLSMGYSGYYDNIGDMTNKGVELDLTITPIRTKDLNWSVNLNMTHYKNKITLLAEGRKGAELDGYKGYASSNYFYGEGLPMYSWRLKKYAGVSDEGQQMWYYTDKEGKEQKTTTYSDADYHYCGTALPDLYGGFGTNLTYKGIDLGISFTYSIGGKALDKDYASLMSSPIAGTTGHNIHKDILNAWSESNPTSNIPRWQYADTNTSSTSDRWLTDASWLTLQNVNLGYTFPRNLVKALYLTKLRVYVAGDNLFYWSKRKGFDPRSSFSGDVSRLSYSPIRSVSGGISVQF